MRAGHLFARRRAAALAAAFAVASTSAGATEWLVSGSGTWGASVPATSWSAPDATWSFSFRIDDPVLGNTGVPSDFSYRIDGVAVSPAASLVVFFSGTGGLFTLTFPEEVSPGVPYTVNEYGADVITNAFALVPGVYSANSDVNGLGQAGFVGFGSGAVTILAAAEMPSWTLALAGFAGLAGLAGRTARRRNIVDGV